MIFREDSKEALVHASATLTGTAKMLTSEKLDLERLNELIGIIEEVREGLRDIYIGEILRGN